MGMTCLETCIVAVVIGAVVLVVMCGIISKIFDEYRTRTANTGNMITRALDEFTKGARSLYDDISKKEAEKEAKRKAEYEKQLKENPEY
jgi:type II secretory pathway pseudopilin PulG